MVLPLGRMTVKIRTTKTHHIADARTLGGGEKRFPKTPAGKRAAQDYLRHVQAEHNQQGAFTNPTTTPTFEQAVVEYLAYEEGRARRGELGVAHLGNKRVALQVIGRIKYEGRPLNAVRLGELRPGAIKREVLPVLFDGVAYGTAQKKAVILKHMLRWAVETAEILRSNPATVSLPKKPAAADRPVDRISKETVAEIIAAADDRYRLAIRFAAFTGLRAGEQLALTWDDIDFNAGVVRVRKAIKAGGSIGLPKTRGGARSVALASPLLADLRAWKLAQPRDQRRLGLVFPNDAGGYQDINNLRKRGLHASCKRAGVEPLRWHDLRHYFASILLFDLQETDAVVTSLMGHHSIAFTHSQYGHWMPEARRDQEIGDRLAKAFSVGG